MGAAPVRRIRGFQSRVLLLLVSVCGPFLHGQNTIHVPADQPTIQAGINAAQNGDTVLVAPGTYNENIDFQGKGITVTSGATSYSGAANTIINGKTSGPVVSLTKNEPATAILNGFTIQGGFATFGTMDLAAGVAIVGSAATVANNTIQGIIGCGVLVGAGASPIIRGNDIRKNTTVDIGQPQKNVCQLVGATVFNAGAGVVIGDAESVIMDNNIIEQNSTLLSNGTVPGGDNNVGVRDCGGICLYATRSATFTSNIIRNNASSGVNGIEDSENDGPSQLTFIQNLFYFDQPLPGSVNAGVDLEESSLTARHLIAVNNTFSMFTIGTNFTADDVIANNVIAQLNCNYVPQAPQIFYNDIYEPSATLPPIRTSLTLPPATFMSSARLP